MGHERTPSLPKTRRWTDIVGGMESLHAGGGNVVDIVRQTTENVRSRFQDIQRDPGVLATFKFLVALAVASRSPAHASVLSDLGIELAREPTPLSVVTSLRQWVSLHEGAAEYASLAEWAAADAIGAWYSEKGNQRSLFASHEDLYDVWRVAASGAGFCELSRLFFARFIGRYLN